jgi:hypothetical protein
MSHSIKEVIRYMDRAKTGSALPPGRVYQIVPKTIKELPRNSGWKKPAIYRTRQHGPRACGYVF